MIEAEKMAYGEMVVRAGEKAVVIKARKQDFSDAENSRDGDKSKKWSLWGNGKMPVIHKMVISGWKSAVREIINSSC